MEWHLCFVWCFARLLQWLHFWGRAMISSTSHVLELPLQVLCCTCVCASVWTRSVRHNIYSTIVLFCSLALSLTNLWRTWHHIGSQSNGCVQDNTALHEHWLHQHVYDWEFSQNHGIWSEGKQLKLKFAYSTVSQDIVFFFVFFLFFLLV